MLSHPFTRVPSSLINSIPSSPSKLTCWLCLSAAAALSLSPARWAGFQASSSPPEWGWMENRHLNHLPPQISWHERGAKRHLAILLLNQFSPIGSVCEDVSHVKSKVKGTNTLYSKDMEWLWKQDRCYVWKIRSVGKAPGRWVYWVTLIQTVQWFNNTDLYCRRKLACFILLTFPSSRSHSDLEQPKRWDGMSNIS